MFDKKYKVRLLLLGMLGELAHFVRVTKVELFYGVPKACLWFDSGLLTYRIEVCRLDNIRMLGKVFFGNQRFFEKMCWKPNFKFSGIIEFETPPRRHFDTRATPFQLINRILEQLPREMHNSQRRCRLFCFLIFCFFEVTDFCQSDVFTWRTSCADKEWSLCCSDVSRWRVEVKGTGLYSNASEKSHNKRFGRQLFQKN